MRCVVGVAIRQEKKDNRSYCPGIVLLYIYIYEKELSMSQQVVVTTDAPVALKPLLASAIQSELRLLDLGLARTTERLRAFETQYGFTSEEFTRRFEAGEVDESLDFIEWAGEIQTARLLQGQRQALQSVQLH